MVIFNPAVTRCSAHCSEGPQFTLDDATVKSLAGTDKVEEIKNEIATNGPAFCVIHASSGLQVCGNMWYYVVLCDIM